MAKKPKSNQPIENTEVDWIDITEGTPIANFKESNTLILKFLDNGSKSVDIIELKDENKNTKLDIDGNPITKEITTVKFNVIDMLDNNLEKIFNTGSKRCIDSLKALLPLKDKMIRINKVGSGYQTKYNAKEYSIELLADYINLLAKENE